MVLVEGSRFESCIPVKRSRLPLDANNDCGSAVKVGPKSRIDYF